jgi:hypothetical protein
MKHNAIRYSMIALLMGSVALAAGRANAQNRHRNEIHIESLSWGISSGQIARVSLLNVGFGDGSIRTVSASIQLLDTEGEVIAQSDEMAVAPGKIRFWDVPREMLTSGEPTGRIQVRVRMLVTTHSVDLDRNRPPVAATVELVDSGTGRTVLISTEWVFVATI